MDVDLQNEEEFNSENTQKLFIKIINKYKLKD